MYTCLLKVLLLEGLDLPKGRKIFSKLLQTDPKKMGANDASGQGLQSALHRKQVSIYFFDFEKVMS